jgi:16S rRNA (uracil1498-N3)-methyltransferase
MRQFVLPGLPYSNGSFTLEGREYRYLVQVLRKEIDDILEVRLPDDRLCSMRVTGIDRTEKTVDLCLTGTVDSTGREELVIPGQSMPPGAAIPEGFPFLVLFQWILKGPKMDQVIRQATETGVALVVPVAGDRCLSRSAESVGNEKTGRWDRIVREARQQSGSPVQTRVVAPLEVSRIADFWHSLAGTESSVACVLTEAPLARKSLHEYLVHGKHIVALATGPEGGMSPRELDLLAEAGFVSVHFKTNILRAETAALYGIAAVQSALTESEKWQLKESYC